MHLTPKLKEAYSKEHLSAREAQAKAEWIAWGPIVFQVSRLMKKFGIFEQRALLPTLPIAGVDGTLEKRMKTGICRGNVHAKTGTVRGVSTLGGYCQASNGHTLCFAILNQGIVNASDGRGFQDRVCEAICR